jgi:hypothetical protein
MGDAILALWARKPGYQIQSVALCLFRSRVSRDGLPTAKDLEPAPASRPEGTPGSNGLRTSRHPFNRPRRE